MRTGTFVDRFDTKHYVEEDSGKKIVLPVGIADHDQRIPKIVEHILGMPDGKDSDKRVVHLKSALEDEWLSIVTVADTHPSYNRNRENTEFTFGLASGRELRLRIHEKRPEEGFMQYIAMRALHERYRSPSEVRISFSLPLFLVEAENFSVTVSERIPGTSLDTWEQSVTFEERAKRHSAAESYMRTVIPNLLRQAGNLAPLMNNLHDSRNLIIPDGITIEDLSDGRVDLGILNQPKKTVMPQRFRKITL